MLSRIFPSQIDNSYLGSRIAIWLFVPIVLSKLLMGINSMIMTRYVATAADGIPIDSYNAGAAQAVLAFFALWGLGQLVLALQGVLVLIRYRAMMPLMYLLLLIEHIGRKVVLLAHPVAKLHSGGVSIGLVINLFLLAMLLAGFFMSLRSRSCSAVRI